MESDPRRQTLQARHEALNREVDKECNSPFHDDLETSRKKKLKLSLKDGLEGIGRHD